VLFSILVQGLTFKPAIRFLVDRQWRIKIPRKTISRE
jgi:hypothetical protein